MTRLHWVGAALVFLGSTAAGFALRQELRRQLDAAETRRGETVAYYTAWVHQIKTPIAAMRLTLQGEDTPAARRLTAELGRIEQYVDMVLTYLRLEESFRKRSISSIKVL